MEAVEGLGAWIGLSGRSTNVRILQVNKFYDLRGGAERVLFDLEEGLRMRGHEVVPFAMLDPRNQPSPWARHFVPPRDYGDVGLVTKLRQALLTIWDPVARSHLEGLLDDFTPEVAHLHNIYHQLSPSVLGPLRRRGIPVVMTLHDYKLACPSYQLLRDGAPCEKCVGARLPVWCAVHVCSRDSRAESIVLSIESSVHRMLRVYERGVDRFLCPSRFLAGVMSRHGLPAERLEVVPNAPRRVGTPAPWSARAAVPTVLYAGRLSREKGVDTLVEASRRVPQVEVRIAGDGPLARALRDRAADLPRVRFLGRLDAEALDRERAAAWAGVLPSRWQENGPLSVLETFAAGRGMLVSDRGGLPEMVDEACGRRVPAGDVEAWGKALGHVAADEAGWARRGMEARRRLEEHHDFDRFLDRHEEIYARLLQRC
jgi:glycosyltransferase involved in cell wall biosynthesis